MKPRLATTVALLVMGAGAAARQASGVSGAQPAGASPAPQTPAAVPPSQGSLPVADLTAQLRRGVEGAAEGDPDALIALRQLHDQRLRPLFAHLAASGKGEQRVQAALGLAELDDPPRLDAFLLKQFPTTEEQVRAIDAARAIGLFSPEQAGALLLQPDLAPAVEARLAVIAASGGATVDQAIARRLAASDAPAIAATGWALLAHAGLAAESAPALERALTDETPEGGRIVSLVLQHARAMHAKALADFAARAAERAGANDALVADAVDTLLALAPDAGRSAWGQAFGRAGDLAQRLRLSLVAIERAEAAGAETFSRIGTGAEGSAILAAIARAGTAVAQGKLGESDALALIETDYPPAVAWAVNRSGSLGSVGSSPVRVAAVARLRGKDKATWSLVEEAVRAAALLADEAPDDFARAYTSACWDKEQLAAQTMLLGALRARTNRASAIVASAEAPGTEAKALAAIAAARADGPLTPAVEATLVQAAGGWGGLSIARRAQAAWLALRRAGQERGALAVVLTPTE